MRNGSNPDNRPTLSRRACLGGGAMVLGLGASTLVATRASAKTEQSVAKYQDKPKGEGMMCSNCSFFQAPAACQLVEGTISPNGYCQLFAKKAG